MHLELGVNVTGRIDRVDTWNGHALVRDYKSGKVDRYKVASWRDERVLQAPLYMEVLERLFENELKVAGGRLHATGRQQPRLARAGGGRN